MKKDEEDINVNRKRGDRVDFETPFIQSIYDTIDYLRDEATYILSDLEENVDDLHIEELGETAVDHLSDFVDDLSQLKDEVFDGDDLEVVRDMKASLNRDADYVRRAKRKMAKLSQEDKMVDSYKINIRIIELCNKAINVNSKNNEAYYLKGRALMNFGQYDEAINQFIKSLALSDDVEVRLAIGDAYRFNNKPIDAIAQYEIVLERDENSFKALKGEAIAYFDLKEYEKSNELFKKAESIDSLYGDAQKIWDECKKNI